MEISLEHIELQRIAAGDMEAFKTLFFRFQPRLVNFLTGLTHDKEISRDMSQDIFLVLWRDREKLSSVKSFSGYLFQMARYVAYDYFDRLTVSEKYAEELLKDPTLSESNEENLFVQELQELINRTVEQMSPQRRLVYKLSREKGFSNEEIARQLNISKRTVENHLTAALAILRKALYLFIVFHIFNGF